MKIQPVSSPHDIPTFQPSQGAQAQAKSRAVAILEGKQNTAPAPQPQQQAPVRNPSQVSPEEMTAITQPSAPIEENTQEIAPQIEQNAQPQQKSPQQERAEQLAKRERQLHQMRQQQRERDLKAREEALAAKEAELQARLAPPQPAPIRQWTKEEAKADPIGFMQDTGLTYEEFTQAVMQQQPSNPKYDNTIARLEAKIAKLEQEAKASQDNYTQQQTAQYQAALRQIETDVKDLITTNPNDYEAIAKTGTAKQVVKLIEKTYQQDGILLSVEEAAQEVENYLVDENWKMFNKINKLQQRAKAQSATGQPTTGKTAQQPTQPPPMKTLTNAASSPGRRLSARERAIAAFKGEPAS